MDTQTLDAWRTLVLREWTAQRMGRPSLLSEGLSREDMAEVRRAVRDEAEQVLKKAEKRLEELVRKELQGKRHEDQVLAVVRNAIVSMYKSLWQKKNTWTGDLTARPS